MSNIVPQHNADPAAHPTMATDIAGAGLENDGAGRLRLKRVEINLATAMTATAAGGAAAPTIVFRGNFTDARFDVGDTIYLLWHMPYDMEVGSPLVVELHCSSLNTTASRFVKFSVAWSALGIGEVVTAPANTGTITAAGDTTLPTVADTFFEIAQGEIAGGQIVFGDHIGLKITRVASAGTAPSVGANEPVLWRVDIEYISDSRGVEL